MTSNFLKQNHVREIIHSRVLCILLFQLYLIHSLLYALPMFQTSFTLANIFFSNLFCVKTNAQMFVEMISLFHC